MLSAVLHVAVALKKTSGHHLGQRNIVLSFERVGLPRPAILFFVFVITIQKEICTSFLDPKFSEVTDTVTPCLCWTGLGLRTYIAEKFVLLSAMLHQAVALKRKCDIVLFRGKVHAGGLYASGGDRMTPVTSGGSITSDDL